MLKKAKIFKAAVSIVTLFSFVYWGLDPDVMCKVVSETPQTCGYSKGGSLMNAFGSLFAFMLSAMAAAILALWFRKD
ncbi:hypothetical protein IOM43_001400 [Salmonella enterica]|nr:hypothetical protein [Salmonella enterica]EDS2952361.1 hypothetical protein [Salmonella enterica]EEH5136398.1 hypothetical protein [Salmonella enterica]EGD3454427.1 hypothetical protein [Salmonella enterica]EGK0901679.1 hypothetical protein [Salmonella enterica]